jgi:hypothetical protein
VESEGWSQRERRKRKGRGMGSEGGWRCHEGYKGEGNKGRMEGEGGREVGRDREGE